MSIKLVAKTIDFPKSTDDWSKKIYTCCGENGTNINPVFKYDNDACQYIVDEQYYCNYYTDNNGVWVSNDYAKKTMDGFDPIMTRDYHSNIYDDTSNNYCYYTYTDSDGNENTVTWTSAENISYETFEAGATSVGATVQSMDSDSYKAKFGLTTEEGCFEYNNGAINNQPVYKKDVGSCWSASNYNLWGGGKSGFARINSVRDTTE